jgi:hypothetical protein
MTGPRDTFPADLRMHTGAALLRAKGNAKAEGDVLAELIDVTSFALALIAKGNAKAASELFEGTTAYLLERTTYNTRAVDELLRIAGPEPRP